METYAFSVDHVPASAVARLRFFLQTNRLAPPPQQSLFEEIVEWFGAPAFAFAASLRGEGSIPNWHLIRREPVGNPSGSDLDPVSLAPSLSTALGALLHELDAVSVFPDTVSLKPERITFLSAGGSRLASIEPIATSAPDARARHRVEELLKGCRARDCPSRRTKRLSTLPGLEHLSYEPRIGAAIPSPVLTLTPSNLAGQLRAMLTERFAIDLRQHQAQEALAALFGFADWQHLLGRLDDVWTRLQPTALCVNEDRDAHQVEVTLYQSSAEALAAFAISCQRFGSPLHLRQHTGGFFGRRQELILYAFRQPPTPLGAYDPIMSCSLLQLCESFPPYDQLARAYLRESPRAEALLLSHFGAGRPLVDRYRLANRRWGVASQDELFVDPWLISRLPIDSYEQSLTFAMVSPGHPPRSLTVSAHKAALARAADGWHLLHEYGQNDLGPLARLTSDAAELISRRFGIEINPYLDAL